MFTHKDTNEQNTTLSFLTTHSLNKQTTNKHTNLSNLKVVTNSHYVCRFSLELSSLLLHVVLLTFCVYFELTKLAKFFRTDVHLEIIQKSSQFAIYIYSYYYFLYYFYLCLQ